MMEVMAEFDLKAVHGLLIFGAHGLDQVGRLVVGLGVGTGIASNDDFGGCEMGFEVSPSVLGWCHGPPVITGFVVVAGFVNILDSHVAQVDIGEWVSAVFCKALKFGQAQEQVFHWFIKAVGLGVEFLSAVVDFCWGYSG